MRNAAITIEASIHMCLVRWPYLRLVVATAIAQKVVRGHLGRIQHYVELLRQVRAPRRHEIEDDRGARRPARVLMRKTNPGALWTARSHERKTDPAGA